MGNGSGEERRDDWRNAYLLHAYQSVLCLVIGTADEPEGLNGAMDNWRKAMCVIIKPALEPGLQLTHFLYCLKSRAVLTDGVVVVIFLVWVLSFFPSRLGYSSFVTRYHISEVLWTREIYCPGLLHGLPAARKWKALILGSCPGEASVFREGRGRTWAGGASWRVNV